MVDAVNNVESVSGFAVQCVYWHRFVCVKVKLIQFLYGHAVIVPVFCH